MHIQMPVVAAFLRESAATVLALKRLLAAVNKQMALERCRPVEPTAANMAYVLFAALRGPGVHGNHMTFQELLTVEVPLA